MSFLNDLIGLFEHHAQQPQPQPAPAPQRPDITYNPNPNTNIPYSAHSVADAKLGNQYVANPTAPQFRGVDPARFGFPSDLTFAAPSPFRQSGQLQPSSYNNGQVSLNGQFMQGNMTGPEYTSSPYADTNRLRLY